ncbi:MAG TPA: diacylglycerol kinase family protein [Polyangia bacterium]|nr:diacylglycerol kinase family protein [Polyangia bacterium]
MVHDVHSNGAVPSEVPMLLQAGVRSRVAVIVNENARGVRPEVVSQLERLVPPRDLYVSRSLDHSRRIARTVVERAYDGVLFGGGDGTFVQCLDDLARESRSEGAPLPGVGVLRLGTGNALADALGASRPTLTGLAADLRRARHATPGSKARTLELLAVDHKLTPFAGCGLDAQILDDFARTCGAIDRLAGPLAPRIGAGARYAVTIGARSVPRFLLTRLPEVELISTGEIAHRIDPLTGRVDETPLPKGTVLYRGRAMLASAATIPFYGLGLKMFPYAGTRPGFFQFRISTASTWETLSRLPWVWKGEYRTPNLIDFHCQAIELRINRAVPIQIGGDLQDKLRDRLEIAIHSTPLRVLA